LERLLQDVDDRLRRERLAVLRLESTRHLLGEEIEVVLAEELLPRHPEEVLAGAVEADEAQVLRRLDEDHVRDVLEDRLEERRVGALLGVDLVEDDRDAAAGEADG